MCFDGFGQFELDEGALQVVLRVLDFEIDISCQVICEETDAKLKRQEPDRIEKILIISGGQKVACLGEIALQDRRADFRVEADRLPVFSFLPQWIAPGPHT